MSDTGEHIPLVVVGCDFRTASSRFRSRLVLHEEEAQRIALELKRNQAADGFVDLNTCNRTEWLVSTRQPHWAGELLRSTMKQRAGISTAGWFEPYLYTGEAAVRHIFRVALGQESLVVGERQIAGQLNRALEIARHRGTSSKFLNGLSAVACKLVKHASRRGLLGHSTTGVHSLAIAYLHSRLSEGSQGRVAIIGLGSIGKRVLGILEDRHVFVPVACNRTVPEGREGIVRPLAELTTLLTEVDAAIVCTGAPQPVIRAEHLSSRPADRPLLLVDIGIPEQVVRTELPPNVRVAGLDELTAFHRDRHEETSSDPQLTQSLIQQAIEELTQFCSEREFSEILRNIQHSHQQVVSEGLPRLFDERLTYLPEGVRARLEFDLRDIILDYTADLFRAIKDASRHLAEEKKWSSGS